MLRESPSVSWGHPTGAVPAQGVHQGCLQQGQGMSCSGQDCSVQFPLQLNEPGLISALVTLGRPAGSCCSWGLAKPRLVLPAATVSLCVQQFQKGFFFFPQAAPGKCFIFLARYLTGGSGSSKATRCLSLPGLGMQLADPGTAAATPALLGQLPGASSSREWFPASPFRAAPSGMRHVPRTHTQVLRGCSAPAAVALVLRRCLCLGEPQGCQALHTIPVQSLA